MTLQLTNTSRRIQVIQLPHAVFCRALGECACIPLPGHSARRVAASLVLPAGATVGGVAEAALQLQAVQQSIRAGQLRVQREPPIPSPRTPPVDMRSGRRTSKKKRGSR